RCAGWTATDDHPPRRPPRARSPHPARSGTHGAAHPTGDARCAAALPAPRQLRRGVLHLRPHGHRHDPRDGCVGGAVVSKELMAIAQVRWLLESRTALSPEAVDDMLRKYNAELLRRDIKSALAAVLEDEH